MKKFLLPLFILITTSVFGITITEDTKMKWGAFVVYSAVEASGFSDEVFFELAHDLLERENFSAKEAAVACVNFCVNKLEGDEKEKCKEKCKGLGEQLIIENNSLIKKKGVKVGTDLLYSKDKKFYVAETKDLVELDNDNCGYAVYDTENHSKVAICNGYTDQQYVSDDRYRETITFKNVHFLADNVMFLLHCVSDTSNSAADSRCELEVQSMKTFYSDDHKYFAKTSFFPWGKVDIYEANNEMHLYASCRIEDCGNEFRASFKPIYFMVDVSESGEIKSLSYEDYTQAHSGLESACKECVSIYKGTKYKEIEDLSKDIRLIPGLRNNLMPDGALSASRLSNAYSFGEYKELRSMMDMYCQPQHLHAISMIDEAKVALQCATEHFVSSDKYKDVQTKTLESAVSLIREDISAQCRNVDVETIKCSGNCKKFPGTQDYVNCSWGNNKATFEFDDICD